MHATTRTTVRTAERPAPTAASAAACSRRATADRRRVRDQRRSGASGEPRQAVLQGLGARRNARPRRPAAASADPRRARELGRSARSRRAGLPPHHRSRTDPDAVALLRLRPVADRGLLRRQQADEGLHRHREHRYQFAPVHVVGRRRPQARVRRGSGADLLRRSRARRSGRAGRLEHRVVPSDPVPAHHRRRSSSGPT